jgi:hypothetical protein
VEKSDSWWEGQLPDRRTALQFEGGGQLPGNPGGEGSFPAGGTAFRSGRQVFGGKGKFRVRGAASQLKEHIPRGKSKFLE